ncbi:MAG: hypothetical protein AAGD22_10335 [Verrucomicrobiota bacterium]
MLLLPKPGVILDLSERTMIELAGPDRKRYLQGQITNDLDRLETEPIIEACLCNAKGKLEAHVYIREVTLQKRVRPLGSHDFVHQSETAYLIDAHHDFSLDDLLLNRLDKYLIADDCKLRDVSANYQLHHIIGDDFTPVDKIAPIRRFGPIGGDILTSMHSSIYFDQAMTSEADLEPLRIAHGFPAWGKELTADILPPEAGPSFIERNISYTKGCYIGQETISRLKSVGRVRKQLVALSSLAPSTEALPTPGWDLFPETDPTSKPVGTITSTAKHPDLNTTIALAYVKSNQIAPNTRLIAAPPKADPQNSPCETVEIRETPMRSIDNIH